MAYGARIIASCLLAALGCSTAVATLREDARARAARLMEEGRTALRSGDRYTALRSFALARELVPGDRDIRRAVADVLMELGAPRGAAISLGMDVDIGVRSRMAAEQVRWGAQVDAPSPAQRFEVTDAAIASLEELIREAQAATPPDAGLLARLRGDLVVAYRDRERWADSIAMADTLRRSGTRLAPYVRRAQADALLAARRPEDALTAYDEVLAALPADRDARIGRIYALVELEDFDAAFAAADTLLAEKPPWRNVGTPPVPRGDPDWLDAQLLAAQTRRYGDMPADAWHRLHPLAEAAPAATYLRLESGEIAAARGWTRLAHEEILIAHSLAPRDPGVQLSLAESQLRRRQWPDAKVRADAIAAITPNDPRLHRLQDDIAAHEMAELRMTVQPRRAKGGGPNAEGDGIGAALRLYSPPLAQRWRLLAAATHDSEEPEDVRLERTRYGGGIEGRWPDVTLELVAWSNHGLSSHGSADAQLQWQPDDYWSLDFGLHAFSADTPLRAVEAGIRADAASASALYAWNELRRASLGVTTMDFTDGNRRWQAIADFATTVVNRPGLKVEIRPEAYASRNTRVDAPYFNPGRDGSLTVAIDLRHRLWRSYERSLEQRLVASAGGYWQEHFGTGGVGGIEYAQTWRHDPRTEWNYGVAWSRRIYDGDTERAWTAFVRLNQRF